MLYNETILGMSESESSLVSTKELRQQPPKGTVHIPQRLIHTVQQQSIQTEVWDIYKWPVY